ncbi:MAG TPA: peptide chain release factor N(5)-glutamine methyltransferase [Bauldia sp.]|nr:peptide chain release factor N(5)-glutamine methyltransferase [Bauldia sp.]
MSKTVAELRREIAAALAPSSDSAALDARLLVAHAMGIQPDAVLFRDGEAAGAGVALRAMNLADRRKRGEPVARIVGEKEFYGLTFGLSPATLVPRPDTETLVDAVLEVIDRDAPVAILDLGTGTGAILLALLSQLPNGAGVGVDVSADALATAAENAARLGLATRAAFGVGDWARGITTEFAIVVCNPPYIAHGEIASLPVDVRDYDPHIALDGGDDGLDAYRAILSDLDRVLAEDGVAFLEIGFGQGDAVAALAAENGFSTTFRRDLAGIERVAILGRETTVG